MHNTAWAASWRAATCMLHVRDDQIDDLLHLHMQVCTLEHQLFEAFFPGEAADGAALALLIGPLCTILYDALRPRFIQLQDLDELCQLIDILQQEVSHLPAGSLPRHFMIRSHRACFACDWSTEPGSIAYQASCVGGDQDRLLENDSRVGIACLLRLRGESADSAMTQLMGGCAPLSTKLTHFDGCSLLGLEQRSMISTLLVPLMDGCREEGPW